MFVFCLFFHGPQFGTFFSFLFYVVAFRMYDLDGDDRISKEELLAVLTMMVGANISEDQLISIAERTIMEADTDKDNLISFDEFKKVNIFVSPGKVGVRFF